MSRSSTTSSDGAHAASPGELVPALPAEAVRGGNRILVRAVITIFLVIVGGTLVVDLVFPAEVPILIGHERIQDERMWEQARVIDGSWARWVEDHLRLRSRVGAIVKPTWSRFLYRTLGETSSWVLAGKDGWMFMTHRLEPRARPDAELTDAYAAWLAALDRRLSGWGVDFVPCPIPRKSVIYEELLPRGIPQKPELDRRFFAALRERGVRFPDLLGAFRAHRGERLWNKADTHWNDLGQFVAAEEVARAAGRLLPDEARTTRVIRGPETPELGDLYRFGGMSYLGQGARARSQDETSPTLTVLDSAGEPLPFITQLDAVHTPIALVGTSFTLNDLDPNVFPLLLTHVTGLEARVSAVPALGAIFPLRLALEDILAKGLYPELLVWEFPIYSLFTEGAPFRGIEELLTLLPSPPLSPVADVRPDVPPALVNDQGGLTPGHHELAQGMRLALRTNRGRLVHPGDGTVSVLLRGRLAGGPLRVRVGSDTMTYDVTWEPGLPYVVLPVLGWGQSTVIRTELLAAAGPVTLDLEEVRVLMDLDVLAAVEAVPGPPEATADGWRQVITFEDPPPVQRLSGVVLWLVSEPKALAGAVTFTLVPAEPGLPTEVRVVQQVARDAVVILGASPLAGRRLAAIRIEGTGAVPAPFVRSAALMPSMPFPPR